MLMRDYAAFGARDARVHVDECVDEDLLIASTGGPPVDTPAVT